MLNKRTAIFFLTIALVNLVGHGFIPHHHHNNDFDLSVHFQTHHQNENAVINGDLSHHLSHFIHPFDDFTTTNSFRIFNAFSNQHFEGCYVLSDKFNLDDFIITDLLFITTAENFNFISPHCLSSGLRAPPVSMA